MFLFIIVLSFKTDFRAEFILEFNSKPQTQNSTSDLLVQFFKKYELQTAHIENSIKFYRFNFFRFNILLK